MYKQVNCALKSNVGVHKESTNCSTRVGLVIFKFFINGGQSPDSLEWGSFVISSCFFFVGGGSCNLTFDFSGFSVSMILSDSFSCMF